MEGIHTEHGRMRAFSLLKKTNPPPHKNSRTSLKRPIHQVELHLIRFHRLFPCGLLTHDSSLFANDVQTIQDEPSHWASDGSHIVCKQSTQCIWQMWASLHSDDANRLIRHLMHHGSRKQQDPRERAQHHNCTQTCIMCAQCIVIIALISCKNAQYRPSVWATLKPCLSEKRKKKIYLILVIH